MVNIHSPMSTIAFLLVIVIVAVLVGLGAYFFQVKITGMGAPSNYVGFSYKNRSEKAAVSAKLLEKMQRVMQTVQEQSCLFIKPTWANIRETLLKSGPESFRGSCSSQKDSLLTKINVGNLFPSNIFFSIPLSETSKNKVRLVIADFFEQVLEESCENDQVNIVKAVALMDQMVDAFC